MELEVINKEFFRGEMMRTLRYVADKPLLPEILPAKTAGYGYVRDYSASETFVIVITTMLLPSLKRPTLAGVLRVLWRHHPGDPATNLDPQAIVSGKVPWAMTPCITVVDGEYMRLDATWVSPDELGTQRKWFFLGHLDGSERPLIVRHPLDVGAATQFNLLPVAKMVATAF